MKLLIVRLTDNPKGGVLIGSDFVPRQGEQFYYGGKSYYVRTVKYFYTYSDIKEYSKMFPNGEPFVRLILDNQ